jgi:hypothetical protein
MFITKAHSTPHALCAVPVRLYPFWVHVSRPDALSKTAAALVPFEDFGIWHPHGVARLLSPLQECGFRVLVHHQTP